MPFFSRVGRTALLLAVFGLASHFAIEYGSGGLWKGLRPAHAVVTGEAEVPYDLTQLRAVNATLDHIRKKYVEPERVDPKQMFLGALDMIQMSVAQVIVSHEKNAATVVVRVEDEEKQFRVDNVQGHWDVSARLREVFAFLQKHLKDKDVKLPDIEYAAANGMLRTLDPHSVFLSPEAYEEMNVSTSGHFGGLGIVISIRDQMLTVMRPMPGTPAGRSGLVRLDRITKINNESTLNMPLSDAVDRLRGEPGSKVTIWVHRDGKDGWTGSRPFELVREVIRVDSVEHQALEGGVGYVRIKQFQQTTARELTDALRALEKKKSLQGLVLDLREDPGGLLEQAGKVVDTFLEEGMIFATVGASEGRHEQQATRAGTQPNYPMVVLVNEGSASASEIVTGALRNQNRAVVLGQTTFGKGSVQLVFSEVTPENAALKLTIAQYLIPGDISIQGTGVTPDIELSPMTADTLEMDLFPNEIKMRERDLQQSLRAGGGRLQDPSTYQLRYNLPESLREEIRERGSAVDDVFQEDEPIKIARTLVSNMKQGTRKEQLLQLSPVIDMLQKKQLTEVAADLKTLGIDWSPPPATHKVGVDPKKLLVKVRTDRAGDQAIAGEAMQLSVEIKNDGDAPVYQLRGITKSDSNYYDQRELVFGKIAPGESRTATIPLGWCETEGRKPGSTAPLPVTNKRVCHLPKDAVDRQDAVLVKFESEGSEPPAPVSLLPTIVSLPRPIFAYTFQVADGGNQNGQLERGESANIYLHVKNVGTGPSYETQANLQNLTGDGILLKAGRFDVSNMAPGESRDVTFSLDVLKTISDEELKLSLSITDRDIGVFAAEKLVVPLFSDKTATAVKPISALYQVQKQVNVLAAPSAKGDTVAGLKPGTLLRGTGQVAEYIRVDLGGTRFGFVESSALSAKPNAAVKPPALEPIFSRSPPRLEVKAAALATRGDTVRLDVVAGDDNGGVQDAFVFVGNAKVYYKPNAQSNGPDMRFSLDAPLKPGINVITVVARESEDTSTRRRLIVRKDGPNGEILPTPTGELFGEDWEFGATE
jgi:carboxyl-terminal processing protease